MTDQAPADDKTSLSRFIESLKTDKQLDSHRSLIRVVPKGLFVDERVVDVIIATYQGWLERQTEGVAVKSLEKCRLRLFEVEHPERYYLTEGKTVLAGHLIPVAIRAPQQYGLPYNLGSLLSTKEYVHPADPALSGIEKVKIQQGRQGVEALISRRDKAISVSQQFARELLVQAQGSRYLQRRYPGIESSLSVALRALISIVKRSRPVPRDFPMVVPQHVRTAKSKGVRFAGKFLLVEDKGSLQQVVEMNGRNLSSFLRAELERAPRDRLRSFRLTPKHRDLMGFYETGGRRTSVHARSFSDFVGFVLRAKDPRERFSGWFTASDAFEKFSSFFQLSQPIERRKLGGAVEALALEGASYRIYGGWVFATSKEGTLLRCTAKHIRVAGERRASKKSP